jgi:hypothetical protein
MYLAAGNAGPGVIPITSNQNATMATRDTATRRSDHDDRAITQLP